MRHTKLFVKFDTRPNQNAIDIDRSISFEDDERRGNIDSFVVFSGEQRGSRRRRQRREIKSKRQSTSAFIVVVVESKCERIVSVRAKLRARAKRDVVFFASNNNERWF
jgi:hypothetical protein